MPAPARPIRNDDTLGDHRDRSGEQHQNNAHQQRRAAQPPAAGPARQQTQQDEQSDLRDQASPSAKPSTACRCGMPGIAQHHAGARTRPGSPTRAPPSRRRRRARSARSRPADRAPRRATQTAAGHAPRRPTARPISAPATSSYPMSEALLPPRPDVLGAEHRQSDHDQDHAGASLMPDSASRMAASRGRSRSRRSVEKTAAASVDDSTAP